MSTVCNLAIPDFCLVMLVGPSAVANARFARAHFAPDEVVSVADGAGTAAGDGDAMLAMAETRLQRRQLTVIDGTRLAQPGRASYVALARRHYAQRVALVIASSTEGDTPPVGHEQPSQSGVRGLARLQKEGFGLVHAIDAGADLPRSRITRQRLATDRRDEQGPFDIIGDVHGCAAELVGLMKKLGYTVALTGQGETRRAVVTPPPGRRLCFVGDLVDRGPNSPDVLRIVMDMAAAGQAIAVPGNHDDKLLRWLNGRHVRIGHGLELTVAQLDREPEGFKARVKAFLESLASHAWLDGGRLAVAHAGLKADMIGRESGSVRAFCLYGETSGEKDEMGLPIRYNWAAEYRGETAVVYGHTPVPDAEWLNNSLCIDTGCCFGGKLSALRWPERQVVSVPAAETYWVTSRPFGHPPPRPRG